MATNVRHKIFTILVLMDVFSLRAFVAAQVGDAKFSAGAHDYTDKIVDNLIDRAITEPSGHARDLDEATILKEDDALAYANQDQAHKKPEVSPDCNFSKKMQISANWRMLSCTNQVAGELEHEAKIGIENESEYSQEFEKAIEDEFIAGMEFAIGPIVKNKLKAEGSRLFESAWSTSVQHETVDTVACEVFGGEWCMWQWHMTFSQCHQTVEWDSPITKCSRGMIPPDPPRSTVEVAKIQPGIQMSTFDRTNKSYLCVIVVLSMAIVSYSMLGRRHYKHQLGELEESVASSIRM